MLTINNLTVSVEGKKIVNDFSYSFKKNKIYAIMGPNGSGKSTLAYSIMGHPAYRIDNGRLKMEDRDITDTKPDKRAKMGIFLSFQQPLSLTGVNVFQLLRLAMSGEKDPLAIKKKIEQAANRLGIKAELIERSLNDGASGGEKKKLEILQQAILDPKLAIFDEVDTGVDIDSLKVIATFINKNKNGKTYILITHYNRILRYIKPDRVLVIMDGKLRKEGNYKLAEEIEKEGYGKVVKSNTMSFRT